MAPFELHNSPLSEQACVGFEYGYSVQAPDALVLWEAQFGDFVNSAQVIVDQFLVSGLAKWGQTSRLTLLLPHGYEGSGPEHSSARLERFLQGAAEGNIRVANCTTPAQYFHLLRRQALVSKPRPLIVMTPKSLLRLPAATSTVTELAEGGFERVIDDARFAAGADRGAVTKLVLCSGKVYYDIAGHEERAAAAHIAVARVEQLYPFPEEELVELMASYPNLERVVWVQEEPRNMGARASCAGAWRASSPSGWPTTTWAASFAPLRRGLLGRPQARAGADRQGGAGRRDDRLEPDASARRPVLEPGRASATALGALARRQLVGDLERAHPPLQGAHRRGREAPGRAPTRMASGATSSSAFPSSMPRTTASATASGVRVPTPGGSFMPDSANIPASEMKPGNTVVTPTPVPIRSSLRPPAKPRRPNFVAE